MGLLQRDQIISQGLKLAAREDLAAAGPDGTIPAVVEFLAWLRRMAADWPWPRLHRSANTVALAAGTQSTDFGAGATITDRVQRVLDPLYIYDSTYSTRDMVRVQNVEGNGLDWDEIVNNPTNRGLPKQVKVRPYNFTSSDTPGKWTLWWMPVPDRAYLLRIPYLYMPIDPGSTDIPWYPVDLTMIHMVMTFALKYSHSPNYPMANAELGTKIDRDKMDHGQSPGINQQSGLDTRYFPQGRTGNRWNTWPSDR